MTQMQLLDFKRGLSLKVSQLFSVSIEEASALVNASAITRLAEKDSEYVMHYTYSDLASDVWEEHQIATAH